MSVHPQRGRQLRRGPIPVASVQRNTEAADTVATLWQEGVDTCDWAGARSVDRGGSGTDDDETPGDDDGVKSGDSKHTVYRGDDQERRGKPHAVFTLQPQRLVADLAEVSDVDVSLEAAGLGPSRAGSADAAPAAPAAPGPEMSLEAMEADLAGITCGDAGRHWR
ncbi:hypothetical protein Q5752_002610 [Cryptotrichosporon argae]